jgi:hypothetical protein
MNLLVLLPENERHLLGKNWFPKEGDGGTYQD